MFANYLRFFICFITGILFSAKAINWNNFHENFKDCLITEDLPNKDNNIKIKKYWNGKIKCKIPFKTGK